MALLAAAQTHDAGVLALALADGPSRIQINRALGYLIEQDLFPLFEQMLISVGVNAFGQTVLRQAENPNREAYLRRIYLDPQREVSPRMMEWAAEKAPEFLSSFVARFRAEQSPTRPKTAKEMLNMMLRFVLRRKLARSARVLMASDVELSSQTCDLIVRIGLQPELTWLTFHLDGKRLDCLPAVVARHELRRRKRLERIFQLGVELPRDLIQYLYRAI